MKNWENRRSFIFNSVRLVTIFLIIYFLTSVVIGIVLQLITPVKAWIWVVLCNVFMLIMVSTKFSEMNGGVDYIMKQLGGIEINQFNQNPIISRYMHVVAEMVIASGIKHPRLFILPAYDINAFAISTNDQDTAIAITEGALTRLTRTELQALVGHEISHILHKDPILNFKLIGWLYGLQSIYLYGYQMFTFFTGGRLGDLDFLNRFCLGYSLRTIGSGGRDKSDDVFDMFYIGLVIIALPIVIISIVIMLMGSIGSILARIIKAIISRQREYLADSESVRFVRGQHIVNVLEKIALLEGDEENHNSTTMDATHQEFSHFYLQNYQEKHSIFDTHPAILKRIRQIRPTYQFPASNRQVELLDQKFVDKNEADDTVLVSALTNYASSRRHNMSHNLVIELGLDHSSQMVFTKLAKCYATFIAGVDQKTQKGQLDFLKSKLSPQLFAMVHKEFHKIEKMNDLQKLQILTLELPKFDGLAKFQIAEIEGICQHLVDMDNKLSIAEYCMMLMMKVHIYKCAQGDALQYSVKRESIQQSEKIIAALLSVTTTIAFYPQQTSAEKCYRDIAGFLKVTSPYEASLPWKETLDNSLPLIRDLAVNDQRKLEDIFVQLSNLKQINSDGQCILFILVKAFSFNY